MTMIRTGKLLARNQDGATAIEFAIYSMFFFAMLFGGIYASILGYSSASLQAAVESAARCRAMGTTCTDATTTRTYAASKFHNVTRSTATFTSTTATCGNNVTGAMDYNLDWILSSSTIHLTAAACFPSQAASGT